MSDVELKADWVCVCLRETATDHCAHICDILNIFTKGHSNIYSSGSYILSYVVSSTCLTPNLTP